MAGATLELESLQVFRDDRRVVDELSLHVPAGQRLALVGPNGAGKTSLLLALVGATPFEGRIRIGGELLERRSLEAIRQNVGYVFADPSDQLFLPSCAEEVGFGPRQRGLPGAEVEARTRRALERVALASFAERPPTELSLGEQRRLALATVLASEPALVLLDEPTASLDPRARRRVLSVIRNLDATVLMATHDLDAVLELEADVLLLNAGRCEGQGPPSLLEDAEALASAGLELPISVAAARREKGRSPSEG